MESENNLIVENAIGGKNYYLFWNKNSRQAFLPKSIPLTEYRPHAYC